MADSGTGYLEFSISELKLDKTFMEKQVTIDIDIDNKNIERIVLGKTATLVRIQIDGRDEIMELKILVGKAGREADHVGKY